jgi:hypothetical protein
MQRVNHETGKHYTGKTEYFDSRSRLKKNPETGEFFKDYGDYFEYQVRKKKNPLTDKNYASVTEYVQYLKDKRQESRRYQGFAAVFRSSFDMMGQPQKWFARQLGVRRSTIWNYYTGRSIPNKYLEVRVLVLLGLDYNSIDEMFSDPEFRNKCDGFISYQSDQHSS